MEEKLDYNSIILYNYLEYIKDKYPHIDTEKILKRSGIEPWETDPGHWFSQKTMNRFNAVIVEATKNENISREAGRHSAVSWPNNFLREMALAYISPSNFYQKIGEIVPLYSKSVWVESRKLSKNRHEVCLYFRKDAKPKKFQCENFQGYLEAITYLYRKKLPTIEQKECFFEDGNRCRFIISGTSSFAQILTSIKFAVLVLSIPILLIAFKYGLSLPAFVAGLMIIFFFFSYIAERSEKRELLNTFAQQKIKPSDFYKGFSKHYDVANIVRDAAYSLSKTTSIAAFIERLSEIFSKLGHKSGIIGLINNETNQPYFENIYIFSENHNEFLDLDSASAIPPSSFLLAPELRKTTQREQNYFEPYFPLWLYEKCLGYSKLTFTPILSENSFLGFIILEQTSKTSLQASDLFLIDAVASQAALSLINILYFASLLTADSVKKEFLTVAAHELLTPIQIANTAIHYIKMKSGKELRPIISALDKALSKLDILGKNLINLSTHYETASALEFIDFNLILKNIRQDASVIACTYNQKIHYSIDTSIKSIKCNQSKFFEAVMNLIQNAAKYTPKGGNITISTCVNQAEFIISIKDDGIGISENFHKKVFLRFFQIDPNINGCGIGLHFCSEVIKKHGGYLALKSPVNPNSKTRKGSEFIIHLPSDSVRMISK